MLRRAPQPDPRREGSGGTAPSAVTIDAILSSPDVVALRISAREALDALRRVSRMPAGGIGLAFHEGGERELIPEGADTTVRGVVEVFAARTSPTAVAVRIDRLVSADAYPVEVRLQVRVRVGSDPGDLTSLRERLSDAGGVVRREAIAAEFAGSMKTALADVAASMPMSELATDAGRRRMTETAQRELERAAFLCGLIVDVSPEPEVYSEAYDRACRAAEHAEQRRRQHEADAALRDARRAEHAREIEQYASLLSKLDRMTTEHPEARRADLIRRFAEPERARLYEGMLARQRTARRTEFVVAAAGDEVLLFSPSDGGAPSRRIVLRGEAGPPRSVRFVAADKGLRMLLVGAATGVYLVDLERGEILQARTVSATPPSVKGGFNSAALAGGCILASHSELGLHRWSQDDLEAFSTPVIPDRTAGASSVRAVQVCGGELYCAAGGTVLAWGVAETSPGTVRELRGARSVITALCATEALGVFAGTADGSLLHWEGPNEDRPVELHLGRSRPVESVSVVESEGLTRVIFTDTSPAVHARVLGDTVSWRYEASGQTLRRAAAAEDVIAAVTELRDRLMWFDALDPNRPVAVVHVARDFGHTIQDVCLAPVA
ncbi:MAG: hypothetical protein KJ057_11615 [Phycisphaerae bacterium]|nr:MAG: hypothetical protein EDS66_05705 [Planctomycetota bacterium]KAB2946388.1 MAG: hypothetical protein F9K17_08650 [Phycisphaerae bacterium]MBE7457283.1 hypothetical protein [Planctomycetia bacterium]MCK6465499.1 hypothetical protein [Phycisphaerae bacterium]MCL4719108.1 hypothetical protein [Phycisphaerae bacterium]